MHAERDPTINPFELALARALLAGPLPVLANLRAQFAAARFVSRELSGAGFFLNMHVPDEVGRVTPASFVISDVFFELEGASHGGGAALFVRGGIIIMLEGYSHEGGWPDEPRTFTLSYFEGHERNMEKLAASIYAPESMVT